MEFGICLISVAPLRFLPDHKSEMVSQVLFGELLEVKERKPNWIHVKVLSDGYNGWISQGQFNPVTLTDYENLSKAPWHTGTDLVQVLENRSRKSSILLTAGSRFYNCKNNEFELLGEKYTFHGSMVQQSAFDPELITTYAIMFLNTPYLWGGKSALGMDCSGFTQLVFQMSGLSIMRDASLQAGQGEMVSLIHEAKPGDLLFFDNEEGIINHVGIMLDDSHIIHAHQKVRIDLIDHQGIFNTDSRKYTHKLRLIKTLAG